jgi:hypothetical protein
MMLAFQLAAIAVRGAGAIVRRATGAGDAGR